MMLDRRSVVPSKWAVVFLVACCALSLVIGVRAADAPKADPKTEARADTKADPKPDAEPASKRPPPSKTEESATIQDDPTLVPDDKESADNNITFPIDI